MKSTHDTPADTLPTLGAPIRPAAAPAPAPVPVAPGVVRNADGTLATTTPPPPVFTLPTLPIYGMPVVHVDDDDGMPEFTDEYTRRLLGCI